MYNAGRYATLMVLQPLQLQFNTYIAHLVAARQALNIRCMDI